MESLVFADDTNEYDGRSLAERPLGGTESSVVHMTAALAARGHEVTVFTRCRAQVEHAGVTWVPLGQPAPETADLYVAVQHPRLFGLVRRPRRRAVWLTWRPNNLKHYKQIGKVWLYRPVPVFMSRHQVDIYPRWAPQPRPPIVVPLGLPDDIRGLPPLPTPPPPHAVFASNPVRGLGWLVDLWLRHVQPLVPGAQLHVYGIQNYQYRYGEPWTTSLSHYLPEIPEAARPSIVIHQTARREDLMAAVRRARVMLYGGHLTEMFCLALAEAQALGVPCVVKPVAVLPERVRHGETGFICEDDAAFAEAAVRLLSDDALWSRQHRAALATQQGLSWAEAAARFEAALLGDARAGQGA